MVRYIALPMGEASGVGPEMIIKALQVVDHKVYGGIIVVGALNLFKKVARDIELPLPFTAYVSSDEDLASRQKEGENHIFYDLQLIDMDLFKYAVELIEDTQQKNISLGKQIIRNCKLAQILSINKDAD